MGEGGEGWGRGGGMGEGRRNGGGGGGMGEGGREGEEDTASICRQGLAMLVLWDWLKWQMLLVWYCPHSQTHSSID